MRSPKKSAWILFATMVMVCLTPVALAIVTSDGYGTHVIENGVPLDLNGVLPFGTPLLNHDTVARVEIARPDHGIIYCSSALINTPLGPGTLMAAHCIADDDGQLIATDLSVFYDELGASREFTTSDSGNMFIHPNYDGTGWHGNDLAVVFWDQTITFFVQPKYDVWDREDLPFFLPVVKVGFGLTGHGDGVEPLVDDGLKRWGLNRYEDFALSECGVLLPGGWQNIETQFTMDFDSGLEINDVFSGYCYDGEYKRFYLGFGPDEVIGASQDSGGPNFVYDEIIDEWVVGAVNSYVFRNAPPGVASADVNEDPDFSWGEWEGDARVTVDLIDQVLGLAPPPVEMPSTPFGDGKASGGHLAQPGDP